MHLARDPRDAAPLPAPCAQPSRNTAVTMTHACPASTPELETDGDLLQRVRAATALLESLSAEPDLLGQLPLAERGQLFQAVAQLHDPDPAARRVKLKAAAKARYAAKIRAEDEVLHRTGIRELRRKPVFTTPNVFPAEGFAAARHRPDAEAPAARTVANRSTATSASRSTRASITSTISCARRARNSISPSAPRLADLRGRVALLTGGRVKIGYQAGLKLLRAGAELIVTTRFPRDSAARYAQEPDFAEWGHRLEIFGLDLRHTPSVEAFCRELLATRAAPRLHHQQRLPDRAPPAGFLRAHDGRRDRGAARHARARAPAGRRLRRPARLRHAAGSGRRGGALAPRATASRRWRVSRAPPNCRRCRCCRRNCWRSSTCSRKAGSIRTCSRSTCASAIPGGC